MWARILNIHSAKRRSYNLARAHVQGNTAHRMADTNQPFIREVDLNSLVPAIGESSQPREDQVDGPGIIIPSDFIQEPISVFGDPHSG